MHRYDGISQEEFFRFIGKPLFIKVKACDLFTIRVKLKMKFARTILVWSHIVVIISIRSLAEEIDVEQDCVVKLSWQVTKRSSRINEAKGVLVAASDWVAIH